MFRCRASFEKTGDYDAPLAEAAAGYAAVLARDPDELNAVYLSGVLAAQRGDPATAI